MGWQQTLQRAWLTRGLAARLLQPIAMIYGYLWRQRWRRTPSVPPLSVPVIVVGNVIVGGAGKTPITRAVAEYFRSQQIRVAIISKGYGRRKNASTSPFEIGEKTPADACGDEPLLLAQTTGCPVWVGGDRDQTLRAVLAQRPDTQLILCDDGLQDLAVHRDLELIVFDERGVGNGWLLPAGPLREPWPQPEGRVRTPTQWVLHSIATDDAVPLEVEAPGPVWHVRRTLKESLQRLDGQVSMSFNALRGAPVQVVTAIAKPNQFIRMLRAEGLDVVRELIRPDHDALEGIEYALSPDLPVLVTAKDATKLHRLPPPWQGRVWVVDLEVRLPDALLSALSQWREMQRPDLSSQHG